MHLDECVLELGDLRPEGAACRTVRLRSVDVDVSARYCSLVADMWFVDTPLLALDTDACPTEDWGERGASMARRPGDQF